MDRETLPPSEFDRALDVTCPDCGVTADLEFSASPPQIVCEECETTWVRGDESVSVSDEAAERLVDLYYSQPTREEE